MTNDQLKLLSLFANHLRPASLLAPVDWIRDNVIDPQSARSPHIDLSLSPFLTPILEAFLHAPDVKQINLLAPTGSGKSTLFVALLNYLIANDAGNTLVAFQNEQEVSTFAETRLFPTFKNNPQIQPLLPRKRHAARKTEILFPHMNLWTVSATRGQLQSKSCRYLIADELWAWEKGMLREFKARHHDRFNRKVLLVSQGGDHGTDWAEEFNLGQIHHFAWHCPACSAITPYDFRDLHYDKNLAPNWQALAASTRLVCPHCAHEIPDTIANRRTLANHATYLPANNANALADTHSYTFNALACYWLPWGQLATEWSLAVAKKNAGDPAPLRQFLQKRLAQNIQATRNTADLLTLHLSASALPSAPPPPSPEEKARFLTVDVQKDHYWHTIYAVTADGHFSLLSEGRLNSLTDIESKQAAYQIPSHHVALDSGFNTQQIRLDAGLRHWLTLNGTLKDDYIHKIKGQPTKLIFSPPEKHVTNGIITIHINYSSQKAKDLLASLIRSGKVSFPANVSKTFISQMQSEAKTATIDKRTGRTTYKWTASANNSHMFDTSCMAIILAMAYHII